MGIIGLIGIILIPVGFAWAVIYSSQGMIPLMVGLIIVWIIGHLADIHDKDVERNKTP